MDKMLHFGSSAAGTAASSAVGEQVHALFPMKAIQLVDKNRKKGKTMNKKVKSYNAEYEISNDTPKVKTLDMRLAVTDRDLGEEIRRVFELAKGSGQELNLTFSCETF